MQQIPLPVNISDNMIFESFIAGTNDQIFELLQTNEQKFYGLQEIKEQERLIYYKQKLINQIMISLSLCIYLCES